MAATMTRQGSARFRAMGSTVDILVHGDPDLLDSTLLDHAQRRIADLEGKWSRFRPDSEVARCNETRGLPVFMGADTRRLVRTGVRAWQRTGGACDPSVLDALIATGYDRPFEDLGRSPAAPQPRTPLVVPGCAGIDVDDELGAVTLPIGTGFDPGAIGKGLAADIVVEELLELGAVGAFVSIGGDIRVAGLPVDGDGWAVPVHEPAVDLSPIAQIAIRAGAIATSTDRRRRWNQRGVERHHVIDPQTATTAEATPALVTTVTVDAWWAEALATQLMLADPPDRPAIVGDDAALIVDADGSRHWLGRMRELAR